MRICSIASGSSGNCTYVGTEETHILVDAGISCRRIEQGLASIHQEAGKIDGILITHEHSDHISGLSVLARRYHIPVYLTGGTADAILRGSSGSRIDPASFHEICEDESFRIGDLEILPFTIPHDAAQPVGYRMTDGRHSAAVATDMGKYNDYIVDHLTGLNAILLEANHDVNMLEVGPYPYPLKQRILGDRGHLSNENAGRLLCRILHDGLQTIFLGHLSKENNYERLAYETVCSEIRMNEVPYTPECFRIEVAKRDSLSCLAVL